MTGEYAEGRPEAALVVTTGGEVEQASAPPLLTLDDIQTIEYLLKHVSKDAPGQQQLVRSYGALSASYKDIAIYGPIVVRGDESVSSTIAVDPALAAAYALLKENPDALPLQPSSRMLKIASVGSLALAGASILGGVVETYAFPAEPYGFFVALGGTALSAVYYGLARRDIVKEERQEALSHYSSLCRHLHPDNLRQLAREHGAAVIEANCSLDLIDVSKDKMAFLSTYANTAQRPNLTRYSLTEIVKQELSIAEDPLATWNEQLGADVAYVDEQQQAIKRLEKHRAELQLLDQLKVQQDYTELNQEQAWRQANIKERLTTALDRLSEKLVKKEVATGLQKLFVQLEKNEWRSFADSHRKFFSTTSLCANFAVDQYGFNGGLVALEIIQRAKSAFGMVETISQPQDVKGAYEKVLYEAFAAWCEKELATLQPENTDRSGITIPGWDDAGNVWPTYDVAMPSETAEV